MPHVALPKNEFKIVVLGDVATGKTSLILRWVEGHYRHQRSARPPSVTLQTHFWSKTVSQPLPCKVLVWDTAGGFGEIAASTFCPHAAAVILTYDVTEPTSLLKLKELLRQLIRTGEASQLVVAICACKGDLESAPGLEEEAERLASVHEAIYVKTSAKDHVGVQELFSQVAAAVLNVDLPPPPHCTTTNSTTSHPSLVTSTSPTTTTSSTPAASSQTQQQALHPLRVSSIRDGVADTGNHNTKPEVTDASTVSNEDDDDDDEMRDKSSPSTPAASCSPRNFLSCDGALLCAAEEGASKSSCCIL